MTLKDWLKLNPNHSCSLQAAPGDQVRAILKNGDGIDERIVGEGTNAELAIGQALTNRRKLVERLTNGEATP